MHHSVVIPAHNEERLLPRGLEAIDAARQHVSGRVDVIVVANRCTDSTAAIAESNGAVVIENHARNIAAVRNAGARAAHGEVVITVDADSLVCPNTFGEIERLLNSGRYVGGGTKVRPKRSSTGIRATLAVMELVTAVARVSGAMFWCRRQDFESVGGFDERLLLGEDVDFARRLRVHGRQSGRRFGKLRTAPLTISTRKFDRFGDWHMFRMAAQLGQIRAAAKGTDTAWVDRYFFDFNDEPHRM